jgi:hypothetical protein
MEEKDILAKVFEIFPENRSLYDSKKFPIMEFFTSHSLVLKKILRLHFAHIYSKFLITHDIDEISDDNITYVINVERLVEPFKGKFFIFKMNLTKWDDKWIFHQWTTYRNKQIFEHEYILDDLSLNWLFFETIFKSMRIAYDDLNHKI